MYKKLWNCWYYKKLEAEGISVALFKGAVLAQLYPQELLRVSGDVDLLVEKCDEDKTIKLLESYGYEVNKAASKENVTVLSKGDILVIELHSSLWEDYKGEHIEKLKNMHIDDKNAFIKFQGCDIECNTLNITNHFQYIFYHVVKHFIPGGIGIRHLMDIALFYNYYEKDIDMDTFRKNMEELGYGTFYKSIFSLCIAHLGMKNTCLKDKFILESDIYQKMMDDIIDAGVFGNKTIERVKSRNIVKQTYYEQGSANGSKKYKVVINTLFPSAEAMSDKYVNAKKYKILLPVAWTQRAISHVIRKAKNKEEPDVWSKAKVAEDRLELLRTLGL